MTGRRQMSIDDALESLREYVRGDRDMGRWVEDEAVAVIEQYFTDLLPLALADDVLSPSARAKVRAGLRRDLAALAEIIAHSEAVLRAKNEAAFAELDRDEEVL
jgi:galactokinase